MDMHDDFLDFYVDHFFNIRLPKRYIWDMHNSIKYYNYKTQFLIGLDFLKVIHCFRHFSAYGIE